MKSVRKAIQKPETDEIKTGTHFYMTIIFNFNRLQIYDEIIFQI